MISESKTEAAELPQFSFRKKPIDEASFQRHQSQISNIIPSSTSTSNTDSASNSNSSSVRNLITLNGNIIPYREVDYDEQIRAPRMSLANCYTYGNQGQTCRHSIGGCTMKLKGSSSDSSYKDHNSIEENKNDDETAESSENSKYLPANFDLWKPTRRFSVPVNSDNNTSESTTILNYTSDNYIYEKDNENEERLLRALDNLNTNKTSDEKMDDSNLNGSLSVSNDVFKSSFCLKQMYELKKPLCTPAVLRPIKSTTSLQEDGSNYKEHSEAILAENREIMLSSSTTIEPTHVHWKPDNFSNHCLKCFTNFASFFFPSKRRHHCRYCGFVFCSNCLIDSSTEIILLDLNARFIIPVFSNLKMISFDANLVKSFKNEKICKKCGVIYSNLLSEINSKKLKMPYIFVENPYVKNASVNSENIQCSKILNSSLSELSNEDTIVVDANNRKSSINNVPNDWMWSSF